MRLRYVNRATYVFYFSPQNKDAWCDLRMKMKVLGGPGLYSHTETEHRTYRLGCIKHTQFNMFMLVWMGPLKQQQWMLHFGKMDCDELRDITVGMCDWNIISNALHYPLNVDAHPCAYMHMFICRCQQ